MVSTPQSISRLDQEIRYCFRHRFLLLIHWRDLRDSHVQILRALPGMADQYLQLPIDLEHINLRILSHALEA